MSYLGVNRWTFAGSAALVWAVQVGCAAPQRPLPPPLSNADVGGTQWLVEVEKPSDRILKGFDAPQRSETWQVGSEVLYSVRIEGRGPILTRFVHMKLCSLPLQGVKQVRINPSAPAANEKEVFDIHDPAEESYELPVMEWTYYASMQLKGAGQQAATSYTIKSSAVVAWMALYDEAGKRLQSHYSLLPESHLRKGLARYCEWAGTLDPSSSAGIAPTAEQMAWIFESQAALFSFGAVVNSSPVAEPLMKHILPRSTLLGIWLFGKPKIGFNLGRPALESRRLPALAKDRPAWQLPLQIAMNDEPVLQCRVTVTAPESPFDLCAGVVAFEGRLIDNPARRFQMHLIAAGRAAKAAG